MTALDAADLLTVRYAANLPLLLASSPRLSSQLAQTRPTPPSTSATGANDPNRYTRCTACGAETIGGLSGSYWLENGHLVGHCSGCRRSTVRRERGQSFPQTTTTIEGKAAFERVKKRRRTAAAATAMTLEWRRHVADDELLHPTALLAKRRADPISSVSSSRGGSRLVSGPRAASPSADNANASGTSRPGSTLAPDASSSKSAKRSKSDSASARSLASYPAPTDSARPAPASQPPSRGSSARPPPPTPLAAVSRPSSSRSESPACSTASQTAGATSRSGSGSDSSTTSATAAAAATAAAKKRKRPKQPSGLAGLLAQKKERELASTNAAKGAGGLMDFLQEL